MARQVRNRGGLNLCVPGAFELVELIRDLPGIFHQGQKPTASYKVRIYGRNLAYLANVTSSVCKQMRRVDTWGATIYGTRLVQLQNFLGQ